MTRHPIRLDTSNWGSFDANNPEDAKCEAERQAFTAFMITRLDNAEASGSDEHAILVGGLMSLVQVLFATHGTVPPEASRSALHDALDFCWMQCEAIVTDRGRLS